MAQEGTHPTYRSARPLADEGQLGRYQLIYRIGSGGMADVFLAREKSDAGLERWVAIKRMHRHLAAQSLFVQMLLDEARLAARIQHPNVAQTLEIGETDGVPFIVMEYLHGEPLSFVIRKAIQLDGAPDLELMTRVVADACEGAHAAHELRGPRGEPLGLVHRDLSPQNIFVTYDGAVKVMDFGVAKAKGRSTMTEPGTLKGKFSYMSPEQASGHEIDRRSDVFALGCVLYKATTGLKPFGDESDLVILARVQKAQFTPPDRARRQFPSALGAIVTRSLAEEPRYRPATARELGEALEHYLLERRVLTGPAQIAAMMRRLFGARIDERERLLAAGGGPLTDLPGDALADESALSPVPDTAERSTSGISVRMLPPPAMPAMPHAEPGTIIQDGALRAAGVRPVGRWILLALVVTIGLLVGGVWLASQPASSTSPVATMPPSPSVTDEDLRAAIAAPRSTVAPTPQALPAPVIVAPPPVAPPATPEPTPTTPTTTAPDRPAPRREGTSGIVNVRSTPWSNVIIDGRPVRATPVVGFRLSVGSHSVRLVTSDGRTATRRIVVSPGRTTVVDVRF